MYDYSEFVEAGGWMSYGPDNMVYSGAADFVDRSKAPTSRHLPVEQPKKFELTRQNVKQRNNSA